MPQAKRRRTTKPKQEETPENAGAIPPRFSGETAPEPSVVLSEEERRAAEHAERVKHNEMTGGGAVQEGELQDQLDEHNRRTGDPARASWS